MDHLTLLPEKHHASLENVIEALPVLINELDHNSLSDETILLIWRIPEEEIEVLNQVNYPLAGMFRYIRNMVEDPAARQEIVADLKGDLDRLRDKAIL